METYVASVVKGYSPALEENVMKSIFSQYERVVIESLITSFGLDFIFKDKYGGDVDTIHNVRKIGTDSEMEYKNAANEAAYNSKGEYDSHSYHSHKDYIRINREVSEQRKSGVLTDSYTDEKIARNGKSDLDHVISSKEIHEDRGRILAELKGEDLANCESNLKATNPHTNRTKKADSMDTFLDKHGDEYTEEQKNNMREKDTAARSDYNAKLERAYYTSPKFAKDLSKAAAVNGAKMGAKQALGFIFAEIWFSVKEEFRKLDDTSDSEMDIGGTLRAIGNGVKQGLENAKAKYKDLFERFISGSVAGALSSIATTICNIFFTTAKNVVKIIRMSFVSMVQAAKVLFLNPDGYSFGDRICAVAKILATGASVVVGTLVTEAISKTPLGALPVAGEIVSVFCGTLISGIISCTLLYFFDNNKTIRAVVEFLNRIPSINKTINELKAIGEELDRYSAELMKIDIETFKREATDWEKVSAMIDSYSSEEELEMKLKSAMDMIGIKDPWADTHDSFDSFMEDEDAVLVFK